MFEKKQFKFVPLYDKTTDSLTVIVKDEPSYGRPIDDQVVVFYSVCDGAVVGFEISGFRRLAETLLKESD